MHKRNKIILSLILAPLAIIAMSVLILGSVGIYLYYTADFKESDIDTNIPHYSLTTDNDSVRICKNGSLIRNEYGLWEARISGSAVQRGTVLGLMEHDLLDKQEDIFIKQIRALIPSESYIRFLLKTIVIFNRNMASYIPQEYREEIYAMASSCSKKYDIYGSAYARQLNYHAAHDIGHAMQEYMLVGCSSFAVWGSGSSDSTLIIGRNFDFHFGDEFAANKLILFVEPDNGYRFASITWPGMIGVVSGMNEYGLTVTINAAKGAIPLSSAMPISLLVRHILQYARTIDEAYALAQAHKTFVSESLLIGSAQDKCAAIIEKTPEQTVLFRSDSNYLICTNHYQSDVFRTDKYNRENIETSDSPYRYSRLKELVEAHMPVTPETGVAILRNRLGIGNTDIGLTNEKSINQDIAHHAVVFKPEELKMWVSTAPWQSGAFLCYDLQQVLNRTDSVGTLFIPQETIAADSSFIRSDFNRVIAHRKQAAFIRKNIAGQKQLPKNFMDDFIHNNPEYYEVYDLAGDYAAATGNKTQAEELWNTALTKEIPRTSIRHNIEKKITEK